MTPASHFVVFYDISSLFTYNFEPYLFCTQAVAVKRTVFGTSRSFPWAAVSLCCLPVLFAQKNVTWAQAALLDTLEILDCDASRSTGGNHWLPSSNPEGIPAGTKCSARILGRLPEVSGKIVRIPGGGVHATLLY